MGKLLELLEVVDCEAWMATNSSVCLVIWFGGLLVCLFVLFGEFTHFEQGYKGWEIVQDMVSEPLWEFLLTGIWRPIRITVVLKSNQVSPNNLKRGRDCRSKPLA